MNLKKGKVRDKNKRMSILGVKISLTRGTANRKSPIDDVSNYYEGCLIILLKLIYKRYFYWKICLNGQLNGWFIFS